MNGKRRITIGLALGLVLALGATLAFADTDIRWRVFGSGGNTSSSTNYGLGSTAGQTAIGESSSTNYRLGAGFWYSAGGCADFDQDAQCDVADADDDNDGCTDTRENQVAPGSQTSGGLRNPMYVWDFMDQWTGSPFVRDKIVAVGDIGAVVNRFGGSGNPSGNPLTPPAAATGYHTSADRSGSIPGQDPWDLNPPDGIIAVGDIGAVVAQFGHTCM